MSLTSAAPAVIVPDSDGAEVLTGSIQTVEHLRRSSSLNSGHTKLETPDPPSPQQERPATSGRLANAAKGKPSELDRTVLTLRFPYDAQCAIYAACEGVATAK